MISSSKIPTSAIDARLEREAQARAAAVAEAGYVPAASALRARIADLLSLRDRAVHPRPKLGRPGSAWLKLVVLDGRLARTLEPGSRARESREFARRDLRDVVLTMSREPGFPAGALAMTEEALREVNAWPASWRDAEIPASPETEEVARG